MKSTSARKKFFAAHAVGPARPMCDIAIDLSQRPVDFAFYAGWMRL
jgi:hypothetical protein